MQSIFKLARKFEAFLESRGQEGRWVYHVDIFEPEGAGTDYPVVRHSFYGKTKEEAQGYYESHLKTDDFLKDCVDSNKWEQVKCTTETHWEKL